MPDPAILSLMRSISWGSACPYLRRAGYPAWPPVVVRGTQDEGPHAPHPYIEAPFPTIPAIRPFGFDGSRPRGMARVNFPAPVANGHAAWRPVGSGPPFGTPRNKPAIYLLTPNTLQVFFCQDEHHSPERNGRSVPTQPNRSAASAIIRREYLMVRAGTRRGSSRSGPEPRSRSRFAPHATPPHTPHGFPPTPLALASLVRSDAPRLAQ